MRSIALLLAAWLACQPIASWSAGSTAGDWGKMTRERADVLRLTGDAARGQEAFRICRGCHRNDAAGVADGTYPRLTGQHADVIIKQITDVRSGLRANPKMEPFADSHALQPQEIADIAVYIEGLTSTRASGTGPVDQSEAGRRIYKAAACETCHGPRGEGDAARVFPALAAQHYGYLLREMQMIKDGSRRNSHPDMVRALRRISAQDMAAVADFLSRLPDYRANNGTAR